MKLKFAKSWIGFKEVNFFGYQCTHKSFKLTEDRKLAIMNLKFPSEGNKCKKTRIALGCGVFFSPFVLNYSTKTKHLSDMTKASFNWDESTWKHEYKQEFEDFKVALRDSCSLFYPDYNLRFIVRTDASEFGVGDTLLQEYVTDTGQKQEQTIALCSQKFSDAATRWSTIYVVVNLFTKFVSLSPGTTVSAENLVKAIWLHWTNFGHTDMIISDLGSDLNSKVFESLVKLMGMRHTFSIADSHANGSERTIKEVVRHLRALAYDKRIEDIYDDPLIIPSIQYMLNSLRSSESAYSAFELTFGTQDVLYTDLLIVADNFSPQQKLLQRLISIIASLREASTKYQRSLDKERVDSQDLSKQNMYQTGDYVMFDTGPKPKPKMSSRHRGPFRVIAQVKNDVQRLRGCLP